MKSKDQLDGMMSDSEMQSKRFAHDPTEMFWRATALLAIHVMFWGMHEITLALNDIATEIRTK